MPTLTKPKLPTPRKQSQKIEPEIDATTPRRRFAKAKRKFEENCHLPKTNPVPTQTPQPILPTKPDQKLGRKTIRKHEHEPDQGEQFGTQNLQLQKPKNQRAQKLQQPLLDVSKSHELSPIKIKKQENSKICKEGAEGGVKTLVKKWGYLNQ